MKLYRFLSGPDDASFCLRHFSPNGILIAKNASMFFKRIKALSRLKETAKRHKVTAALNRGWALHGSPTYAFDAASGTMRCGQAVIKEVAGGEYDPQMKLSEQ